MKKSSGLRLHFLHVYDNHDIFGENAVIEFSIERSVFVSLFFLPAQLFFPQLQNPLLGLAYFIGHIC